MSRSIPRPPSRPFIPVEGATPQLQPAPQPQPAPKPPLSEDFLRPFADPPSENPRPIKEPTRKPLNVRPPRQLLDVKPLPKPKPKPKPKPPKKRKWFPNQKYPTTLNLLDFWEFCVVTGKCPLSDLPDFTGNNVPERNAERNAGPNEDTHFPDGSERLPDGKGRRGVPYVVEWQTDQPELAGSPVRGIYWGPIGVKMFGPTESGDGYHGFGITHKGVYDTSKPVHGLLLARTGSGWVSSSGRDWLKDGWKAFVISIERLDGEEDRPEPPLRPQREPPPLWNPKSPPIQSPVNVGNPTTPPSDHPESSPQQPQDEATVPVPPPLPLIEPGDNPNDSGDSPSQNRNPNRVIPQTGTGGSTGTGEDTGNQNEPNPNIYPESQPQTETQNEPCQCNGLEEGEDYMIVKPQRIQVPVVKEVAGKPVTEYKTITIISIKGVSNASDVRQAYEIRAQQRTAQINAKNQRTTIQGQVTANNGLLVVQQTVLNGMNTVLNGMNTVLNTVQTVANTTLTVVKSIAGNSFVQKAIAVLNFILALHNALMLSRNVAETVADTVQLALKALGFNITRVDEYGNKQEVQLWDAVSGTVQGILQTVLGKENLATIQVKLASLSRIYHAASSVVDATMDYFNTTWRLAEITVGNIGKIGNALRKAGQVFEDAYETMEETFWGNREQRFKRLTKVLEDIEESADVAASIASTKISVGQAKQEIQDELSELDKMLKDNSDDISQQIQQQKEQSTVEVDLADISIGNLP